MYKAGVEDVTGKLKRHIWVILFAALTAGIIGVWLKITPPQFWAKIRLIGYALCHQLPGHSFFDGGHQFPLCARCTGMYLGSVLGLGVAWRQKYNAFPAAWVWGVFSFFLLAFGFDGINSALGLLPGLRQVYPSQNWLRLATGLGMGLAMGSLLIVALRQAILQDGKKRKLFEQPIEFYGILLCALLVGVLTLWSPSILRQALMLLSVSGAVLMLTLIYTVPISILLFRQKKAEAKPSLVLPVLAGFWISFLQLTAMAYLRFWLTGTWLPLNL